MISQNSSNSEKFLRKLQIVKFGYTMLTIINTHLRRSRLQRFDLLWTIILVSFLAQKQPHLLLLDDIDWYMRIDDDSHVQVDHLESFLNQLDPNRPLFIGAPGWVSAQVTDINVSKQNETLQGFGKHEEDFIESGFAFCMGGPGIIFSKGLLQQIKPNLRIVFIEVNRLLLSNLTELNLNFSHICLFWKRWKWVFGQAVDRPWRYRIGTVRLAPHWNAMY